MRKDGRGHGRDYDERRPVRDSIGALLLIALVVAGLVTCSGQWAAEESPKSTPERAGAPAVATPRT